MGVTLGKKQLNKGRISLYLNYSHNGKRRKEYLGIILEPPVTPEARAENKNKILIAKQIRAKKELEFLSVEYALNKTAETFEDILPEAPSNGPDFFRIMNEYLSTYGEFYQFNLSSCIRQQNSLTAQFVSFSLANLANIFYPPPIFTIINLCLL